MGGPVEPSARPGYTSRTHDDRDGLGLAVVSAAGLEGRLLAGRYRILRLIGTGGMGAVYSAEQEDLGKRVAVKVLHGTDRADAFARFRQEALAVAKLAHPNIVQVTDFQAWPNEPPLIVMEELQGSSLRDVLLREGKLAPERAVPIATQILAGLGAAHAAGIVHRDVKPANVFLTQTPLMNDVVKLLDFGIAKGAGIPGSLVTQPGVVMGTAAYIAPERVGARADDPRADLYAVGVCLFEMLSGRRPYEVKTLDDLVIAIAAGPPPALSAIAPDLPIALAAAVDRALQHDPEARPRDAGEMIVSIAGPGALAADTREAAVVLGAAPTESFQLPQPRTDQAATSTLVDAGPPVTEPLLAAHAGSDAPARAAGSVLAGALPAADETYALARRAARYALLSSALGTFCLCFPFGFVAIFLGLSAQTLARRGGQAAPWTATVAIVVGAASASVSVLVFLFGGYIVDATRQDAARNAARIRALDGALGQAPASADLTDETACRLAERHLLRSGYGGDRGPAIGAVSCRGALRRAGDRAELAGVDIQLRSGRTTQVVVCLERGTAWEAKEARLTKCDLGPPSRPTQE